MKVTLIKQFKNHPVGMELDVSGRIYDHLLDLKVIAKPKARERISSSSTSRALKEPVADRMIKEAETKSAPEEEEGKGKE